MTLRPLSRDVLFRKPKPIKIGEGVLPQSELPAIDEDTFLEATERRFPEIALEAKSPEDVVVKVDEFANADPDAFLADLKTQGRTRDTEIMLQGFGFKGEEIDELFPPELSDEDVAEILRVGDVSDEEINRLILERRTAVPEAIVGRISFLTDPAGWWERRHQEYIENVPSEQKAAAIRRESLANTEGIIGLVNSPLWRGGLSATDIAGLALLTYSGLQATRVGWQFLVRTYTMRQAQQLAGGRIPKDTLNSFVDTIMKDKTVRRMMGRQFVDSIFRRTPKGFQASPEAVSRMEEEVAALIRTQVSSIIPRGTQTGALAFGGLPAQPGALTVAIWNTMTAAQRVASAERAGLEAAIGERAFENLTESEKSAMAKVIPETAPDVVPPTALEARLQTELVKEGFAAPVPEAVPEVEMVARDYPVAGEIVDGRRTRMPIPNQESIEASLEEFEVLADIREVPMSAFPEAAEGKARTELANEIETSGEITPLIVVIDDKGAYILEGANRFDALVSLGAKSFPAQVVIDRRLVPEVTPPPTEAVAEVPAEVTGIAPTGEVEPIPPQPTEVPPTQPPKKGLPPPNDMPPSPEPVSGRPRTLADLSREAKGMRALTPEQRAASMDVNKPISEDDLLFKVKPFNEHGENLLQNDTPIKRFLRNTPGVSQAVAIWNPAQMNRDNKVAMIGVNKNIYIEIETGRARLATLRWWHDAEKAFKFKRVTQKWRATKVQISDKADPSKPYHATIHDLVEHPENYILTTEQEALLKLAQDMQNQILRDAQRAGVDAVELTGDYWRRIVAKAPADKLLGGKIQSQITSKKGYTRQRAFDFVDEGAAMGFEYYTHPLETLQGRMEAGIRTIADQGARKAISALPGVEKPLERLESRYPQTVEGARAARQARDEAKAVYIKDKTVENLTTLREAEADFIDAQRELFNKKIQASQPNIGELKLPNSRIAPQELVNEVQKWIDLPEIKTGRGVVTSNVLAVSQLLRTTLTNVDLAAGFIQGQSLFYRNNLAWWRAQANAVVALIHEPTAFVSKNFPVMDEGMRTGAISIPTEFMFTRGGLASLPTRIPVIGGLMKSFNRAFEWFIVVGQTELYKSTRTGAIRRAKGQITPAGVELEKEAMDALVELGSAIRKELGTESMAILGVRPTQHTIEQLTFFAARFFRANIGIIMQSVNAGQGGREARRAMGSLIAGGLAILIGVSWATKKELPNMDDPFAPDWMQVPIGRTYFNPFGPFYPYFRAMARSSVYASQGDFDKAVREIRNFFVSKAGLPIRAADIIASYLVKGEYRTWEGDVLERTPLGITQAILGEMAVPISIQEALEAIPEGRPESVIAEVFGIVGRGSPYNQMDILFQSSENADINPEGKSYRYAENWQEAEMEKRHPDIAGLMVGSGQGVWADASQMWAEVDEKYFSQEDALTIEFVNKTITPQQFRDRYNEIQQARHDEKSGINRALNIFQDERDMPDDPNDRALAEYYLAFDQATTASGRVDWDRLDEIMERYENFWSAEQKNFVERNTGLTTHPPLIQEYLRAKKQLNPYWELPATPSSTRRQFRIDNPEIDAILVRWYGYKPAVEKTETITPSAPTTPETTAPNIRGLEGLLR
ncbi:hypothetical protein LCGC14_0629510 [marine sediment metagenome]|uniref:ParB/Sulfiredoxin domain-containing protein n=1 Tax=marine sediment metagenome TaxID=412755 RepID=A0A0F9TNZ1_9ZZZZ